MLNKCHKTTLLESEKTKEGMFAQFWWYHCLHCLHCAILPSFESLHQGRRHLQYTSTACSDLIRHFERTGFLVESGNMTASWFSKQLMRCFLICVWSLMWAAGSSPWHKLTAVEIANKPQSVPPFWRCMFTIRKIIFFSVGWRMADTCSFRLYVGDGTSTTPGGQLMLLTTPSGNCWGWLSGWSYHRNIARSNVSCSPRLLWEFLL